MPAAAHAFVTELPASLAPETLSETVPTAFAVFDLSTQDYGFEWVGPSVEGVNFRLAPGTVQWVRVADVLVLPRARLVINAPGAESGRVTSAGFSQALSRSRVEVPVALISGEGNPIDFRIRRAGKDLAGRVVLRFRPRKDLGSERVFTDASCSRFGMKVTGTAQSPQARGWGYIGCRMVVSENTGHRTSSLEAYVFWDGVGQTVRVGGADTPESSVSVWPLRLRSEPGEVTLTAPPADTMTIRYGTPENLHLGSIGMGLGPYWDHFSGNGEDLSTVAPVLTLYGSYFITEQLRLLAFDATTIDPHLTTDFGLYIGTEYLKFLDRRVVINLLLGAHALGFRSLGEYYVKLGVPQGVEITLVDVLKKSCNVQTGFFLYPLINGKSYYNVWFRWGSPRLFGEFNYISWDETLGSQGIHTDTAGVSIGFPIGKFF